MGLVQAASRPQRPAVAPSPRGLSVGRAIRVDDAAAAAGGRRRSCLRAPLAGERSGLPGSARNESAARFAGARTGARGRPQYRGHRRPAEYAGLSSGHACRRREWRARNSPAARHADGRVRPWRDADDGPRPRDADRPRHAAPWDAPACAGRAWDAGAWNARRSNGPGADGRRQRADERQARAGDSRGGPSAGSLRARRAGLAVVARTPRKIWPGCGSSCST